METNIQLSIKGTVTPFIRTEGREDLWLPSFNAIQTMGLQALATGLAYGKGLSKVYFLYASSSSPSAIGASGGTLTAADFVTAGSASGHGLVECPAFATGVTVNTSASPTVKPATATILSVTSPYTKIAGIDFENGRYVYAVGLVTSTDDGDILYAACDITPVAKAANSQVGVRWQTTLSIS